MICHIAFAAAHARPTHFVLCRGVDDSVARGIVRRVKSGAMLTRIDRRAPHQLRPVLITLDFIRNSDGSVLIELGDTRVICTATIEDAVPPFLRDTGRGWVTAEYGMLPGSST